jgi:hypothetical protein
VLGLAALVPWTLALASALPELRNNEVLLVLVPTDFSLALLKPRARGYYVRGRLLGLALVSALRALGQAAAVVDDADDRARRRR